MRTGQSIEWEDVIKKEARGTNDDDLGEVQDIGQTYVVTQKGTINREKFFLPKYLVQGYDGDVLRFRVSEDEARSKFVRDTPPSAQDYSRYRTSDIPKDTRIPVMGEKLGVSRTREATITKEPVSEKKTQVSITQKEIKTKRWPACKTVSGTKEDPISSLLIQNSIDLVGETVRTSDNQDLGKIESVENEVIIIKRVLLTFVDLHYYYIPFAEVQDWDGKVVLLKISRDQVEKQYSSHDPPRREEGNVKDSP